MKKEEQRNEREMTLLEYKKSVVASDVKLARSPRSTHIEAQRSGFDVKKEEQRNEREMTLLEYKKSVVASDVKLATTWWTIQDSNL